jgi:outer membrane protein TolC
MKAPFYLASVLIFFLVAKLQGQSLGDSGLQQANLQQCVQYALAHQPSIQQLSLNEEITERQIKTRLADWYPQISLDYTYQHFLKLPVSVFPDFTNPNGPKREVTIGVKNTSTIALSLNQNIFNRDVLLASRTANVVRQQARQLISNNKIDVVVNVSKSYYDVLLTQKQIDLLNEDIIRLDNSLRVAFAQYQGGLVDKIDYKRATISLNNAKAEKRNTEELIKAKFAVLKQQMGYPDSLDINLQYDSAKMVRETVLDTTQMISYESRIEFQLLQTQQSLQEANIKYNRWSYIPSLSAFANYNLAYQNDVFLTSIARVSLIPLQA